MPVVSSASTSAEKQTFLVRAPGVSTQTQSLLHGTPEDLRNVFIQASPQYVAAAASTQDSVELLGNA